MGLSGTDLAITPARAALLRAGAGRSGWPVLAGVKMPLYALSGVARSGATRSNYHSCQMFLSIEGVHYGTGKAITDGGVLWESLSITDVLNEEPSMASFTVRGFVPVEGQEVIITLGSKNNLVREIGGQIIRQRHFFLTDDDADAYALSVIDYTWGLNKRLVSGYYTGSWSTIAAQLVSEFAPEYTSEIEAGLPTVDGGITFTNQPFDAAMSQGCKRVGANWFCDYYRVVKVFTENVWDTNPTIVNAVHATLIKKSLAHTRDLSQVVTRAVVEGGGGQTSTDVPAGETILPVTNIDWYETGTVVAGQGGQQIDYTGVDAGGGGGLVGPGVSPSGVLVLAAASGTGVETGAHDYAATFVTASGESLPSPISTITTGVVAAPLTAPVTGTPTIGTGPNPGAHDYVVTFVTASGETIAGPSVSTATTVTPAPTTTPTVALSGAGAGVDDGDHDYSVSFVTAIGETTPGPIGSQVTTSTTAAYTIDGPNDAPNIENLNGTSSNGLWSPGDSLYCSVTYLGGSGETNQSPISSIISAEDNGFGFGEAKDLLVTDIPVSDDPNVFGKVLYVRNLSAGTWISLNLSTDDEDAQVAAGADGDESPPSSNTADVAAIVRQRVALTAIPLGDANVTSRNVYRRSGGAGLKLQSTIANNTATTLVDTTPNASLGAAPLAVSTAYLQRIPLTNIPVATGSAIVTDRNIYRTEAGGVQLKLAHTLPGNVTTTWTDTVTDASLGADVPVVNTATANQVSISGIPIGAADVTGRNIYRTETGASQLKLQSSIANNTDTTLTDSTADASLGANVPVTDTSGLTQPVGQVLPGSTEIVVADTGAFKTTGGWAVIGNGEQVIRYHGMTVSSLTGIPASGPGAILAAIGYNSTITATPQLTGIPASGEGAILLPLLKGDDVNIWIVRDDEDAQTALAALIGGDGIQEEYIQDRRLARAEAEARGDALLALKSAVEVSLSYQSRDINNKAGTTVRVHLGPPFNLLGPVEFLIQSVTQTFLETDPQTQPLYTVEASSIRFTFEQFLQLARN